ncbi:MAG TPA: YegS/Rv2252/BmrU family lipid kinase [Candidatus Cybelea sp.]|nr:YegS/Rv2252/BmrU family lipid kinase [Candidatus Cybelea sp.]
MRVRLVVNRAARRGSRLGDAVAAELVRRGIEVTADETVARGLDAIVVAGGDGTVAGQIPRALALGIPIGIVPLGTFNDLAHALKIPLDVADACALIAAERTRPIDVARVNDAYYATEASIGLSSRLARLQRVEDKQRFGFLAIVASLFRVAWYARTFHVDVAYEGRRERLKAMQLTIANSAHFGGVITVDDAAIDDGWLDCYCVEVKTPFDLMSIVGAIVTGRRHSVAGLRTFRARSFEVRTRRAHRISADGEPAGATPARFEVLPRALRVFVPER